MPGTCGSRPPSSSEEGSPLRVVCSLVSAAHGPCQRSRKPRLPPTARIATQIERPDDSSTGGMSTPIQAAVLLTGAAAVASSVPVCRGCRRRARRSASWRRSPRRRSVDHGSGPASSGLHLEDRRPGHPEGSRGASRGRRRPAAPGTARRRGIGAIGWAASGVRNACACGGDGSASAPRPRHRPRGETAGRQTAADARLN